MEKGVQLGYLWHDNDVIELKSDCLECCLSGVNVNIHSSLAPLDFL